MKSMAKIILILFGLSMAFVAFQNYGNVSDTKLNKLSKIRLLSPLMRLSLRKDVEKPALKEVIREEKGTNSG